MKRKKSIIFDNLGLKIAAVFLSIVLWFYVTSRGQSEIPIDVPLEFTNIPAGLEMVNSPARSITLYVKGQERAIRSIKPSDVRISLNLSKAKIGENIFYITREDVDLPHIFTISSINPSSVKIITEQSISKSVKVIPVVVGKVEKDFFVKSITVEPQYIIIEGTKSEIKKISNVKTEQIDITGLTDTITQDVKPDLKGKNIRMTPESVTVTITIGKGR